MVRRSDVADRHVADGERLAATLYLPRRRRSVRRRLEALPYRKDDVTRRTDECYERYAASGYAVLRLDLRGTGSSTRHRH